MQLEFGVLCTEVVTFAANSIGSLDVVLKRMQRPRGLWSARCSRKAARASVSPGTGQGLLCGVQGPQLWGGGELCG